MDCFLSREKLSFVASEDTTCTLSTDFHSPQGNYNLCRKKHTDFLCEISRTEMEILKGLELVSEETL